MRNDRKTSLILTSPSYKKVEAQLGKKITDIVINSCGIHICCNYQDEDKGYLCKIFGFENSNKFEQCHNYHGLAAIYNGKRLRMYMKMILMKPHPTNIMCCS